MFAANNSGSSSALARETTRHINDMSSKVSQIFTSKKNIEVLHDAIRYRVFVESGGRFKVGRQSDTELALVMRSILLQYGNNDDSGNVLHQVRKLNGYVLTYCVEKVLTEVEAYMQYRVDASTVQVPIDRARPSSIKGKGEKSLEYGASHFI
jgi:hypothetical protein